MADPGSTRREFLQETGLGLAATVLAALSAQKVASAHPRSGRSTSPFHHPPKARRVVQVFLTGGASQVDTFDYKPELWRRHGEEMPGGEGLDTFNGKIGELMKSPWEFRRRGQSGLYCSSLLPHLAECVDDLTFLYGMTAKSANHGPAQLQMNCGFIRNGFPCLGAWVSYALGHASEDLPFFVVLPDPRGIPAGGAANWGPGFLPARHQGTALRTRGAPVVDLLPPDGVSAEEQRESYALLRELNGAYARERPGDTELSARLEAYELAARMQVSVPEAIDFSRETEGIRRLYGVEDPICGPFARNCLLARRLLERGVRFVQLYQGGSAMKPRMNWDAHEDVLQNHTQEARIMDRPVAALIRDLKQRGMLEDTLFLWVTEFGRTPFSQGKGKPGRDHNPLGFTVFMAGAGLRPGIGHGATDEFGHRAEEGVTTLYDFHATVLHLLGLDHTRLTHYHNGIQRRLTDVHGHVVKEILA
jgi:hypothetical protein